MASTRESLDLAQLERMAALSFLEFVKENKKIERQCSHSFIQFDWADSPYGMRNRAITGNCLPGLNHFFMRNIIGMGMEFSDTSTLSLMKTKYLTMLIFPSLSPPLFGDIKTACFPIDSSESHRIPTFVIDSL